MQRALGTGATSSRRRSARIPRSSARPGSSGAGFSRDGKWDDATMANGNGAAPATDVIGAVRRSYDELTRSQKRIAEAIVDDPEFVAFATVDKMAARLGV